jgi:hypothetical protein
MKLKRLQHAALIVCCIHLLTTSIFAQEAESVSLITYWNEDDVFRYEKIHGKKKYKAGVLQDSTAKTSIFKMTVVEATKDEYLMEIGNESKDMEVFESLEQMGVDGSELLLLGMKYSQLKIRYRIDSLGTFLGIDQPELVSNFSSEFAKLTVDALEKEGSKLTPQARALMDKLISPEVLVNKMFQDVQIMHAFFGNAWYLDTLIQYEGELPNLIGGPPIPVDSEVSFTWHDEDIVLVIQQNFVNEQNFGNLMKSTLSDVLPAEEIKGTMTDANQLFIEPASGIVYAYFRDRTINIEPDFTTIEFTEIRLLD